MTDRRLHVRLIIAGMLTVADLFSFRLAWLKGFNPKDLEGEKHRPVLHMVRGQEFLTSIQ